MRVVENEQKILPQQRTVGVGHLGRAAGRPGSDAIRVVFGQRY